MEKHIGLKDTEMQELQNKIQDMVKNEHQMKIKLNKEENKNKNLRQKHEKDMDRIKEERTKEITDMQALVDSLKEEI